MQLIGPQQELARAGQVAAQQLGIARVVEDHRVLRPELKHLCVCLIRQIETAQVVIAGGEAEPRFGILRCHFHGLLIALGCKTIALIAEVDLAHAEVVVGREKRRVLHLGSRLLGVWTRQQHVFL